MPPKTTDDTSAGSIAEKLEADIRNEQIGKWTWDVVTHKASLTDTPKEFRRIVSKIVLAVRNKFPKMPADSRVYTCLLGFGLGLLVGPTGTSIPVYLLEMGREEKVSK